MSNGLGGFQNSSQWKERQKEKKKETKKASIVTISPIISLKIDKKAAVQDLLAKINFPTLTQPLYNT